MARAMAGVRIASRARTLDFEAGADILGLAGRLEAEGRDVVRLDLGEPDLPTPPDIVEAAVRALRDGVTHYTPPGGLTETRSAAADHIGESRGVAISPRQVIVTSGSTQALLVAMLAVLEPGAEVLLADPGYPIHPALVRLAGGIPVRFSMREDRDPRLDAAELRARTGPRTRLLVVSSPGNPTGAVLRTADLEIIAELVTRHGLTVISDEVYGDLVDGDGRAPSILSVPGMAERTICVDSLSKTFAMCGWRIGFAVAPSEVAARMEVLMLPCALCAPSFAQVAAIEALRSPRSAAAGRAIRDELARRREAMVAGLNRIPGFRCRRPEGAFYAFPDVTDVARDDVALARRLLVEAGVAVLPGAIFGPRGGGHLRLSSGASSERIAEGLRRIERLVR